MNLILKTILYGVQTAKHVHYFQLHCMSIFTTMSLQFNELIITSINKI